MIHLLYILFSAFVVSALSAQEYSENEGLQRLPQHLKLDDYHRCLSRRDGLYCYGGFELTPTQYPNPTYDYMKGYSAKTVFHYNRTSIYRGYCVNTRCPSYTGDASTRFKQCVNDWARPLSLRADLLPSPQYCRTHAEVTRPIPLDTPQRVILYVVAAILILNIVGTIYDRYCHDSSSSLLRLWSVGANWQRLVNDYTDQGEPRLNDLQPAHGLKAVVVFLGITAHCNGAHIMLLSHSAEKLEQNVMTTFGMFSLNGTSVATGLLSVSAFLTSYNLLLVSEKIPLSLKLLPLCLLKRITRFTPVFLLTVGYAATWWVRTGDGPVWSPMVGHEADICRKKFWTHLIYANNLVHPEQMCVGTSWTLTVDMQLSIIVCCLTLVLARRHRGALPVLAAMILVSCVINTMLGYIYQWVPLREAFNIESIYGKLNFPSFYNFYIQWWGGLPASLIGVFMAHLYYEQQVQGINFAKQKWLVFAANMSVPVLIAGILLLSLVEQGFSRTTSALFIGFERPVVSAAMILAFYAQIAVKGSSYNFFSWRGFQFLSRLSLPLVINSWLVHMTIAASRPHPGIGLYSVLDMLVDGLATYTLTVMVSIPLTVLVELPVRRSLDTLIFSSYIKSYASDKDRANIDTASVHDSDKKKAM
ncbi:uncharacterized protein LOC142981609 [Anticarsia gemmatalis]|uniref:uncharacterized protein LOC142981609 n=1 Tax=Anticarsia gemmatalis TaxID=129554 RepID=UPI003F761B18